MNDSVFMQHKKIYIQLFLKPGEHTYEILIKQNNKDDWFINFGGPKFESLRHWSVVQKGKNGNTLQ